MRDGARGPVMNVYTSNGFPARMAPPNSLVQVLFPGESPETSIRPCEQ